ncbi:hypothetical protein FGADI_2383 [Fusarium gaditjirri]|uniref:Zn(2)-C6 fungal-type domain-containing protein n=1 Tax=Fusarium gaditjirri TaxID=282569 RepID=A0A8H4TID8_9HYPO|nr:hypothetical protein FGADI_2383 [Fusarium gaditjirri]
MGQDEVGLEALPPPPGYSTSNQEEGFVMPTSFTIHKQADSEVKFNIRGNSGSTPLSIACTYKNTEDDFEARVNLLSRKNENVSPLATVKYSRHSAELEFANTSPLSKIAMYYRLLGDRNATHSFNVNAPQRTSFEWRNLGDGQGWKLYMGSRPEVLALGALNMGSDKPTRFEFTDFEMAKELDEQCKLVIVASWLRIWDKIRAKSTMNYPPLLPRDPTTPFNERVPTLAPKRRAVAVACDACRSRKVRCTGEFPTCAACQRRGGECHYADVANDREMHSNQLRRRVKELEDENRSFRNLFQSLSKPGGGTDQDILRRIQAGDDLGTIIGHARELGKRKRSPSPSLLTEQRPSDWATIRGILPRTPIVSPAAVYPIVLPVHASPSPTPLPSPPINTPRDAILGLLTLSQDENPDLVLLNEARPKEHCDFRLNELSVSYWTRVPISNHSASMLISTFLETDNSVVGFIDKDLFLTDLVQHNPTFCSAFLVSSILYLACIAHTPSDDRAATLAHSFFNDSERLYRAERLSDSLTTLAAINIFSLGCFSHGNDNLGQDLLLSGRQMGTQLYKSARSPRTRLAHLATVSRTWQRIVEQHTFRDFILDAPELPVFQKYVRSERLRFVRSITLRVRGGVSGRWIADWTILRNIFSGMIMSTTAIESIRIEKWWNGFGICSSRAFSVWFEFPRSVKQLSYFHGVSRHSQWNLSSPNTELLDHTSRAADHLEHIAVSYAISASDFFDHCKELEFKKLKTLALTYHFNGIPDEGLLKAAAEAAKRMPALEMLEIWEHEIPRHTGVFSSREAHIFGYKKLGLGKGRITWKTSQYHELPVCVCDAWENVLTGGQSHALEVKEYHLPQDRVTTFTKIMPHLMLKEQILRHITRERAMERNW